MKFVFAGILILSSAVMQGDFNGESVCAVRLPSKEAYELAKTIVRSCSEGLVGAGVAGELGMVRIRSLLSSRDRIAYYFDSNFDYQLHARGKDQEKAERGIPGLISLCLLVSSAMICLCVLEEWISEIEFRKGELGKEKNKKNCLTPCNCCKDRRRTGTKGKCKGPQL